MGYARDLAQALDNNDIQSDSYSVVNQLQTDAQIMNLSQLQQMLSYANNFRQNPSNDDYLSFSNNPSTGLPEVDIFYPNGQLDTSVPVGQQQGYEQAPPPPPGYYGPQQVSPPGGYEQPVPPPPEYYAPQPQSQQYIEPRPSTGAALALGLGLGFLAGRSGRQ